MSISTYASTSCFELALSTTSPVATATIEEPVTLRIWLFEEEMITLSFTMFDPKSDSRLFVLSISRSSFSAFERSALSDVIS